jgi:hypothetical protein
MCDLFDKTSWRLTSKIVINTTPSQFATPAKRNVLILELTLHTPRLPGMTVEHSLVSGVPPTQLTLHPTQLVRATPCECVEEP